MSGLLTSILAASQMIVTPFEDARFAPLDPARPDGPSIAVLRGDPAAGPSDMLMRFGRGSGRLHIHSADYHLVIIEGAMKHWNDRGSEAAATAMGPGGYWFQPGGEAHTDSCLSERCIMFIRWAGRRDSRLPETSGSRP